MRPALAVAVVTAVLAAIGGLMIYPIEDPDLWWLLGAGAYMVQHRAFLTTDPFSATAAGAPWLNHAWGFELLLYGVYLLGGTTALILLQALFAVATFAVVYWLLRREGAGRSVALAGIALGALATRGFWLPRPQLVTYLLLAVFWAFFREYRAGRSDRLAWLPPITAVWANLHGGFMVGPAVLGLGFVGEVVDRAFAGGAPAPTAGRLRRLALIGVACGVAAFANPFHYRAVLFPFQVLGDELAQAFIIEWASPAFQDAQVILLEGLVGLALILLLRSPRPGSAGDLIVLVAFLHFALHARRNLPLLVIILLPIVARTVAEAMAERVPALGGLAGRLRQRLAIGVAAGLLLLVMWSAYPFSALAELAPRLGVAPIFPESAVQFLKRERPPGSLYNDYGWGGYLIWRLYPDYRVSIDGRVAVYGPQRFADHLEVNDVRPRWRETLKRLGFELVLTRARSRLATVLRASPDWAVLHEDELAVVFGRREARL